METYRTTPTKCKNCGHLIDSHSETLKGWNKPGPGSFSVCAYCAHISKFDSEMNLIPITAGELLDLYMKDEEVYQLLIKIRTIINSRKPKSK